MKKHLFKLFFGLFLMSSACLNAQTFQDTPVLPCQTNRSPLFGKDIVIHDKPDRDQRNVAACSAFNGWLYAAYSYNNGNVPYITFLRSTDKGITWNVLMDVVSCSPHQITTKLDIIACGNSISNLKIFLAAAYMDTISELKFGAVIVNRYQGEPFIGEEQILANNTGWYKDIALACDQNFTANNANPFSIAAVCSKTYIKDSVLFYSSSNGGLSFDNRQVVAYSNNHMERLTISYGRSLSKDQGRYFVAWEENDTPNAKTGHIFTSHSEPNFNSPFTTPICIDSLNPALINEARNPILSCQVSNFDNDSTNLTEVLLFEKYIQGTNSWDVTGFYNLQATTTGYFKEMSLSTSSSNNNIRPNISFNPSDSTFMVTYCDSTDKRLPFLSNNVNMKTPDSWITVSSGFNDSPSISKPNPKVNFNLLEHQGNIVWIKEQNNGKGVAMFDAQYSTWTGLTENNKTDGARLVKAFPNPCSTTLTISFELQKAEEVTVTLYNITGQAAGIITHQYYSSGKHNISYNVSDLPAGSYYYTFKAGDCALSKKIIVLK